MIAPKPNKPKLYAPELLYMAAQDMGLQPEWLDYQKIFVAQTPHGELFFDHAQSHLNSHLAIIQSRDKYFTRLILERNSLPNIDFALPLNLAEAEVFFAIHRDIIAKPKRGMGSHDIHHITDRHELSELKYPKYIFEKYTPGREMRYLVLRGKVIAVQESVYGDSVAYDRQLERHSFAPESWDPALQAMAIQIAHIFGLGLAAVDFMIDATGRAWVLEVNNSPGLKWFHAPTSGPAVDVARQLLEATIDDMAAKQPFAGLESTTI